MFIDLARRGLLIAYLQSKQINTETTSRYKKIATILRIACTVAIPCIKISF